MPKIHASGMVTDASAVAVSGVLEERLIAVADVTGRSEKAGVTSPGTDSSPSTPSRTRKRGRNAAESPPPVRPAENP